MASRAPVMHGYALGSERRRRRAWYHPPSDPVVLPAAHAEASPALVVSALIASSIIAGVAYAFYFSGASPLADTATPPLQRSFEPDSEVFRATTLQLLQGPALALPDPGSPEEISESDTPAPAPGGREVVIIDDSQQPRPPYPNPVTTPPDAIGPELDLNAPAPVPAPGLDPEIRIESASQ